MSSQNNELRSQNTELRSQVDRYRTEVDRLEKKLEKFRKKADMADLVAWLSNHSISPQPPSVSEITHRMSRLSTSEGALSADVLSLQTPPQFPLTILPCGSRLQAARKERYGLVQMVWRFGIQVPKCQHITNWRF